MFGYRGYDFWCGEGHTEYEVFGAETNCPYYEYHDWSKGTPSKTEKRFTYEYDEYNGKMFDNKMNTFYHIEDSDDNIEVLCDRLNWLVEENEQLKSKNRGLQSELQIFKEDVTHSNLQINKLAEENEQLKQQLKLNCPNIVWRDLE